MNIDGLRQDMEIAFQRVTQYTLIEDEVEAVYLGLTRLREIEKAAEIGDIAEVQVLLGIEKAQLDSNVRDHLPRKAGTPDADTKENV